MDYGTGHVRYRLTETMARTGLGRSTVTKHVALLRAAGWLAWAQHGSLRNVLRGVGRPGYAATAAVYAATIPPAFDEWAGNRLGGRGYAARVVGATERGREQRVAEAVDNSQRKASDRAGSEGPWTPSLRGVKEEGQVQLEGGFCSTAQRQQKRRTILGQTITAAAVTQAERLAAWVRPLVGWLQRATRRQLSWVLLDLVLLGWDEQRILGWLREHNQLTTWRPRFPHRQIAAKLLALQADEQRIADLDAEQARRSDPAQNAELQQALAAWRLQAETADALLAASTGRAAEPKAAGRYTNAERRQAREYALDERFGGLALVSDLMAEDLDAALDLYGMGLCRRAECMDAIGALA
jgi:hypothetical protein